MGDTKDVILIVFAVIGAILVLKFLLSIISGIWCHFIRCNLNITQRYGNSDGTPTWAAITGATGALGFNYCCEFAQRGFNILIIARNEKKANNTINELNKLYPDIKISFLHCDLGKLATDEKELSKVSSYFETFLSSNDIGILINNAAYGYPSKQFNNTDLKSNLNMVNINISSIIILTQLLIPHFINRCKNKNKKIHSLVLNIGSILGIINSMPGFGIYGGTKAFLNYWSISSSKEYSNNNIDFIITHPGAMASNMSNMKENFCLGVSSTKTYCIGSIKHIGRTRMNIGYWYHALFYNMISIFSFEIDLIFKYKIMFPFFKKLMGK